MEEDLHRAPKRMEIWFAELGNHSDTSVQGGCRPVLIVSNNIGNTHAETVTVLPMTSRKKRWLPTHIFLFPNEIKIAATYHSGFSPSTILAEQITTIDKKALGTYVGRVISTDKMRMINEAVATELGMEVE
ncbi:type II toxin-antitoxin system PemK/MazF family toxin [Porcincola sp. LCP21S3_C12]|uniref:type II toxin-antitoxin system PemK/MazF family toxin n=1 Tax=Porcincola sp. LCP21S3_C12 TaxID=3438798 RepID=UPI003F9AE9D9